MVSEVTSRKSCSFQSQLVAGQVVATLLHGHDGEAKAGGEVLAELRDVVKVWVK